MSVLIVLILIAAVVAFFIWRVRRRFSSLRRDDSGPEALKAAHQPT